MGGRGGGSAQSDMAARRQDARLMFDAGCQQQAVPCLERSLEAALTLAWTAPLLPDMTVWAPQKWYVHTRAFAVQYSGVLAFFLLSYDSPCRFHASFIQTSIFHCYPCLIFRNTVLYIPQTCNYRVLPINQILLRTVACHDDITEE